MVKTPLHATDGFMLVYMNITEYRFGKQNSMERESKKIIQEHNNA